jgi:glutamate N-acetyltransferase/amino-acid N-acetyltransferase
MLPRGFLLSVADAAIKRPGREDMALIYSEAVAAVAGVFTTNKVKAAPVLLDVMRVKSGLGRAILVNSGNANACTGARGMRDAEEAAGLMGKVLGISGGRVYVCSTGVIGVPLPMERVRTGIEVLSGGLGAAGLEGAARAIMTTDTFPKYIIRKVTIGGKEGVIAAICKGAGMIRPDMATMLCFVMTDVAVGKAALRSALREAVKRSFNSITVDGEQSTNDTVLVMANGMLGNSAITPGSRHFIRFKKVLSEVTYELARMIVKDGEGATKLIEVEVVGARSEADAKRCAYAIADSLLVKTAVYGEDPNWGRIMAALGSSGIAVKEEKTDISMGGVKLFQRGRATGREREAARRLRLKETGISVGLRMGRAKATVLTCDLTEKYVRINAEYTT